MENLRKTIAICGVWEDTENLNVFIQSLQDESILKDYVLVCYTFGRPGEKDARVQLELEFVEMVRKAQPAALFLFPEMLKTKALIDKLCNLGVELKIPVFSSERDLKGCINLQLDYDNAFRRMCEHVVKVHGRKRIDMFAGYIDNDFSNNRIKIFEQVLSENGIDPFTSNIYYGDFWDVPAKNVMNELLENGNYKIPEAIVCANDSMAIGVMDSLIAHGFDVPKDLIITGFDGISQGQYHSPALTTCKPNYSSIVPKILDILNNWTEDQVGNTNYITVDYDEILNTSCGCVSESCEQYSLLARKLASENQDYFTHILEMGRFMTRTVSATDLDSAVVGLQDYLWMWKKQYYFIGIEEGPGSIHAVFRGVNGEYFYNNRYYGMDTILPDKDELVKQDGFYNVFLIRQIRSTEKAFGYVACGYDKLGMRDQQRFEEFGFFVSAMVNTVINNHGLIQANIAIEKLSDNDYLTGIYNRRGFFKKIAKLVANPENKGKYLTYFSLDMDGLKTINDTYGHQEGDVAINAMATAIRRFTSGNGECARYGGDEFAFCLIEDVPSSMAIIKVRDVIDNYLKNDVSIMYKPYEVTMSMGVATHIIDEAFNIEELIKLSDEAMYRDKMSRKANR